MSKKVWVYAEYFGGKITEVTLELLSIGRDLAKALKDETELEAVLLGNDVGDAGALLAEYGAQKVYVFEDPSLQMFSPMTYVPLLADLAEEHRPDIFLFGATAFGTTLGPAVAARLKTGMAAHCVDLKIDTNGKLVAQVPSFGGKVIGEILCPATTPQMASVKPGIFEKTPAPVPLQIVKQNTVFEDKDATGYLEPVSLAQQTPEGISLDTAEVVVCGGFGVGSSDNWKILEKLAEYLGGSVACTRPPVDEGWCGEHLMVGTSGRSIRPKVYLGFGVSGATHHLCGMSKADFVVNVNSDAKASVFEVSDVGIVADVGSILPLLLEATKSKS